MIKFIADVNVGKLAKWLRMLGFDTVYDSELEDSEIVRISLRDKRIILTRDTGIKKRKAARHCILLKSEKPIKQLQQVVHETGIDVTEENAFTRCLLCNTKIISIPREKVKTKVPEYIYRNHHEFAYCPKCDKIYWKGSHLAGMKSIISRIKNEKKKTPVS